MLPKQFDDDDYDDYKSYDEDFDNDNGVIEDACDDDDGCGGN